MIRYENEELANDTLKQKADALLDKICRADTDEDEITVDYKDRVIVLSKDDYFTEDRDSLDQAWDDFKTNNQALKEAGIKTDYDSNTTPEWYSPGWELVINF